MEQSRYGFTDLICNKEIKLPKYIPVHNTDGDYIGDIECSFIEDEIVEKPIEELVEELDFNVAQEYYEYIMNSIANGQKKQVKDLWFSIEIHERRICLKYLKDNYSSNDMLELFEIIHQD